MKTAIIKFGPLSLHWYGVIILLAIVAGMAVAIGMARWRRVRADPLAGILLLGLLSGAIGARLWYVAFRRDFYAPDPARVFAVWQGGLALHGGLLGGMLATLIYTWSSELDFWTWADICAPGLILGQAIGRVGDLVNGQAFGHPFTGPLAVTIPVENRPPAYLDFSQFQPVATYEAMGDTAIFVLLLLLTFLQRRAARVLPSGSIFLLYLMLYSILRIPLEGMRLDSLYLGSVRVAQLASGILIALGALGYLTRLLPRREQEEEIPQVATYQPTQAYFAASRRSLRGEAQGDALPESTAALPQLPPPTSEEAS